MKKLINKIGEITGVIEEDEAVGFYLYIYDNLTNECIADYLQDTLEDAKAQGQETYQLSIYSWRTE